MKVPSIAVAFTFAALLLSFEAGASHFRFGHISWTQQQGTTIQLKLQAAWRRDGYGCIDPSTYSFTPCSAGDGFPGVGDVIFEDIGDTNLAWGDGASTGVLFFVVTSVDPAGNWLFGEAIDTTSLPAIDTTLEYTYASPGDYLASVSSCCRISRDRGPNEHLNNPDGDYTLETIVNVGSENNSPTGTMSPIQTCSAGGVCTFDIPAVDPDGETLSFRLASSSEAGPGFAQPPGATVDPLTGTFSWDTAGIPLASPGANTLYSAQVIVEDGSSKVPVDFFIQLVTTDNSAPPVLGSPAGAPPICNTTQVINLGDTKSFLVESHDPDSTDTVTLNVAGLPAGATMTPSLPTSGNPVSSAFNWTPSATQGGVHVVRFTATSTDNQESQCRVDLSVLVQCDVDEDSDVDRTDIQAIMADRNTPSGGPLDPRDADGDGTIDIQDARYCVTRCTLPGCAVGQPMISGTVGLSP